MPRGTHTRNRKARRRVRSDVAMSPAATGAAHAAQEDTPMPRPLSNGSTSRRDTRLDLIRSSDVTYEEWEQLRLAAWRLFDEGKDYLSVANMLHLAKGTTASWAHHYRNMQGVPSGFEYAASEPNLDGLIKARRSVPASAPSATAAAVPAAAPTRRTTRTSTLRQGMLYEHVGQLPDRTIILRSETGKLIRVRLV